MGIVHEAREDGTGRSVALKVLAPDIVHDAELLARFRREERALRAVTHANVVGVLATGEDRGVVFLALELVPGGSLADKLRRGPLPWREVCRLGAQIARALGAVHAAGLVHRDVKPANVILDAAGNAKLTDFGLVRPEKENLAKTIASLTGEQQIVGTFDFMAPEQSEGGGKHVDARTDLYALGVTLHVLLTNRPLFEGSGYVLVKAHLLRTPSPPGASIEGIPRALDELVLELLEKKKEDRPASALEVAARLDALALTTGTRRGRAPLAAAVLVLGLGGLAAAWSLTPSPAPRPAPPPAPAPPPPPPPPAPVPAPSRKPRTVAPIDISRIEPRQRWWGSHGGAVWGCAFSPDGRMLATASSDGKIGIWDTTRSKRGEVHDVLSPRLLLDESPVAWCVAFTADGRRLVSAGHDRKVHVWDPDTGKSLSVQTWTGRGDRLEAIAVSDETPPRVIVGANDGTIQLYRLVGERSLEPIRTFQPHAKGISCVAFFPDERHALSGSGDGLELTDLETGESLRWGSWKGGRILPSLSVSPDRTRILTGCWDSSLADVWDETGGHVAELAGHTSAIRSVAISPDGTIAATGGWDGMVKLWRTDTWSEITTFLHGVTLAVSVGSLAFSPDGRSLVTASEETSDKGDMGRIDNFGQGLVSLWDLVPP
jgi:hypothetical protein